MVFKSSPIKNSPSYRLFVCSGTLCLANVQVCLMLDPSMIFKFKERIKRHFFTTFPRLLKISYPSLIELSQTNLLEHTDYLRSHNNEARIHHPPKKKTLIKAILHLCSVQIFRSVNIYNFLKAYFTIAAN